MRSRIIFSFASLTRQPGHLDIPIKAQADRAVGANQPLTGNRPAWKRLEYLHKQQIGGFDDVRKVRTPWRRPGPCLRPPSPS